MSTTLVPKPLLQLIRSFLLHTIKKKMASIVSSYPFYTFISCSCLCHSMIAGLKLNSDFWEKNCSPERNGMLLNQPSNLRGMSSISKLS